MKSAFYLILATVLSLSQMHARQAMATKAQTYLAWHELCMKGDRKTIDSQIQKFEQVLAADPNDQLARAYLGSAHALRSKATFWGPGKLEHLKTGKKLLDQAVERAPRDLRVRMVRAIGFYKVPKRFQTRETAIRDFNFLLGEIQKPGCELQVNEKQAALYYAYLAFEEAGRKNAAVAKALCHQLDSQSTFGRATK